MRKGGICAAEQSQWASVQLLGKDHFGFKDTFFEEAFSAAFNAGCNSCLVLATSPIFTLPPHSPTHPHPLMSHQCCNPSSPSSLCVAQSWVIGPWIAPFPSLSISCLASDLSLLPTTSISKSGQPHSKRSMIHFSTPARINLICSCNLSKKSVSWNKNQIIISTCIFYTFSLYKAARYLSEKTDKEIIRRPEIPLKSWVVAIILIQIYKMRSQGRLLSPESSISSSHPTWTKCWAPHLKFCRSSLLVSTRRLWIPIPRLTREEALPQR